MTEIIEAPIPPLIHMSAEFDKIALKLAKCQGEFPEIKKERVARVKGKTKDGKFYDYTFKYADLPDILTAVCPVTSKHGLALTHATIIKGGNIIVRCLLIDGESGQWMACEYPACSFERSTHQQIGNSLTYARRHTVCVLLGVAGQTDIEHKGESGMEGEPEADAGDANGRREAPPAKRRKTSETVQGSAEGTKRELPPKASEKRQLSEDESRDRLMEILDDLENVELENENEVKGFNQRWGKTRVRLLPEHESEIEQELIRKGYAP